jgi:hypothetical protein
MQGDQALGRAVGLLGFVGKDIRLDNGKLMLEGGKLVTQANVKLEGDAVKTGLEVRDSAGVLVAEEALGPQTAGEHTLEWDGAGKDGKILPNGAYTFNVVATDVRGAPVETKISSTIKVTGVDLQNGGSFYTSVGKIGVGEVSSVGDAGFSQVAAKAEAGTAARGDLARADGAKVDAVKAEMANAGNPEEAKADAPKAEPAKGEPAKDDVAKREPVSEAPALPPGAAVAPGPHVFPRAGLPRGEGQEPGS